MKYCMGEIIFCTMQENLERFSIKNRDYCIWKRCANEEFIVEKEIKKSKKN